MNASSNVMDDLQPHGLQPDMLPQQQSTDVGYLTSNLSNLDMAMIQVPNFMATAMGRHDSVDESMMVGFDDNDPLGVRRSISYSGSSAQSQSPPLPNHFSGVDLAHIQTFTNPFSNTLEQISPVTAAPQSRRDSDDEGHRAERRRAQNRAAQRAYRMRKDHSLKEREKEVDQLREELEKAQRLNRSLCKVVAVLRERIKNPPTEPTDEG